MYISGGGAASPASLDTLPGGPINGPHSQVPAAPFGLHLGGAVAQLGERLVRNEEVRGSIPLGSTNRRPVSKDLRANVSVLTEILTCDG